MTMITTDVTTIAGLTHREAMDLQARELERTLAMLGGLDESAWSCRTECPDWDVRAMYQHVLGACEAGASMRENLHQLRLAYAHRKKHGGPLEAALSNVQVRERSQLTPTQVIDRLRSVAPKTIRGRSRVPAVVREHARLSIDGPVHERWTLGYLIDTIYLRDLWMHRVDASHAVDQPVELSAAHDGRIVADVVGEWSRRHGQPFVLELTGAAGGAYTVDHERTGTVASISMDAVDFCRTLAGRLPAEGGRTTVVPF
jgi:uncharacterized protein (TIGR03083 family)